jgi:hypothetical protein
MMTTLFDEFARGFTKEAADTSRWAAARDGNLILIEYRDDPDLEKDANFSRAIRSVDDLDALAGRLELTPEDLLGKRGLLPNSPKASNLEYGIIGEGGEGVVGGIRNTATGDEYAIKTITNPDNFAELKSGLTGTEDFTANFKQLRELMDDDPAFATLRGVEDRAMLMDFLPQRAGGVPARDLAERSGTALELQNGNLYYRGSELTDLGRTGNIRLTNQGTPKIVDFSTAAGDAGVAQRGGGQLGENMTRQQRRNADFHEQAGFNDRDML